MVTPTVQNMVRLWQFLIGIGYSSWYSKFRRLPLSLGANRQAPKCPVLGYLIYLKMRTSTRAWRPFSRKPRNIGKVRLRSFGVGP